MGRAAVIRRGTRRARKAVLALWAALAVAFSAAGSVGALEPGAPVEPVEVVYRLPHGTTAFTQGLFFHKGRLYETTGRRGRSHLAELDPADGSALRVLPLDPRLFGEGATAVGDACVWLTWTAGRALVLDLATFERRGGFRYSGEGWGLASDGERLFMSDGGDEVALRDPRDFRVQGRIEVRDAGRPVYRLNELEWARGLLYANIWHSPLVAVIDPDSGAVLRYLDLGPLVPFGLGPEAVANGLAWDEANGCLLATGKLWPEMFCVRRPGALPGPP